MSGELVETKTCARCKQLCSLRLFGWLKKHHCGRPEIHRDSWCHPCRNEWRRTPIQRRKHADQMRRRRLTDPEFRAKQIEKSKEYYQKNREKILAQQRGRRGTVFGKDVNLACLNSRLKKNFGITIEDYYRISEGQENRCAICRCYDRTKTRRLAVDHDHATRKVRALLCHHCNTALGGFKDNIGLLWKAIQYLSKHSGGIREVC